MIIHYMSASRLKKYMTCPESYYQSYEMGVKGSATHLIFGTLMHSVFERWYEEDTLIEQIYQEEWNKANIADPEFYRDGFDIINGFLGLNDKEAHALYGLERPFAINLDTDHVYDVDAVDWSNGEAVKGFLKSLEDENAPIIFGFIDRIEYDYNRDTLRIVDYKTSRVPLTQQEADDDVQLSMYALVADYLYPEHPRVIQELQYVRLGVPIRTSRTKNELELFKSWLISIFHKIKEDSVHTAILNKYCGWCDAKAGCVAYNELINGEATEVDTSTLSDDDLDEQLEKVNIHLKILEGRKKEIEGMFKDKLKKNDNEGVQTRNGERFLTPNLRVNYDIETIVSLFPDDYHNLLTPKKTEIDKLAKGNQEIIQALERTGNKYYIEPTLRKKK